MKAQGRARRRRKITIGDRLRAAPRGAKLVVPVTLVALLATGLVASATPASSAPEVATPALVVTGAAPAVRDDSLERTSRLLSTGRAPLTSPANAVGGASQDDAEKKAGKAKAAKAKEAKAKTAKAKKAKAKEAKAKEAKAKEAKAKEAKVKAKQKAAKATFKPTAAQLEVKKTRYTRVSLNVRTQPRSSASLVTVLKTGSKLRVTGTTKGSWTLVVHRDKGRWVRTQYLVKKKPEAKSTSSSGSSSGGLSMKACSSGSTMESGLTKDAIRVHRAVCARFPSIKSYGGRRAGGGSFHGSGRAVDIMVSGSTGWEVAKWVRANRKRLGVSEIIYSQKIWTVQRGSEGWRSMSSRGNATANHYDHVHVSVYGNSATG